jgi:hypothetical protein
MSLSGDITKEVNQEETQMPDSDTQKERHKGNLNYAQRPPAGAVRLSKPDSESGSAWLTPPKGGL